MTHFAKGSEPYQRRQIVARMGNIGTFVMDGKRFIIWKFMTFYCGPGQPSIAAEFVGRAPVDKDGTIQIGDLKPGELLVTPGFIYRKVPMSGIMASEHLKKMKNFKPRELVEYYKDTAAGAVDLGTTDMRTKH